MNGGRNIAVFTVTSQGYSLALNLKRRLEEVTVFKPAALKKEGLFKAVRAAFRDFDSLVFICASGIAVRSVAPLLKGKTVDPAVIVMDEQGRFVISLLSGHLGGANRLAREISSFLKATPVITTATDLMGLPCIEDIAEKFSLSIEDARKIKTVNSAILKGGPVLIIDENPLRLVAVKKEYGGSGVLSFTDKPPKSLKGYRAAVRITPFVLKTSKGVMGLRPKEFVAGVGCRRGVTEKEIREAIGAALKASGVSPLSVRNLATIDIKSDEKGLLGFARKAGLKIDFFRSTELNRIKRLPSGASSVVMEKTGARGVSEPAALLSSGAKRIWTKKIITGRVTVALARAPFMS